MKSVLPTCSNLFHNTLVILPTFALVFNSLVNDARGNDAHDAINRGIIGARSAPTVSRELTAKEVFAYRI